jgi:hypothetical protein
MHGRERNKTSAPNSPGQTADVDKGSSFLLLELRKTEKGAFGNGVAQLQFGREPGDPEMVSDAVLSNSLSERDQLFPDRRGCRNPTKQMIQKGALRFDFSH